MVGADLWYLAVLLLTSFLLIDSLLLATGSVLPLLG